MKDWKAEADKLRGEVKQLTERLNRPDEYRREEREREEERREEARRFFRELLLDVLGR